MDYESIRRRCNAPPDGLNLTRLRCMASGTLLLPGMKRASSFFFLLLAFLTGCASVGPPLPPSLELPKPPNDLGAQRKGDRVLLTWTVPSVTTDRQRVRRPGPTWICRGLDP